MMASESSQATHGISYFGRVDTTEEAMRLVFAARMNQIPRVTRRLTDRERVGLIASGNVFIFDVEETGIHRWTDGRAWNDSRILGNFLIYRQLTDRAGARRRSRAPSTTNNPPSNLFSITPTSIDSKDSPTFEHPLFMPGGLSKKTITVKLADSTSVHLIAYFTTQDVDSGRLPTLAQSRQDIMQLEIKPNMFDFSPFRYEPETYWNKHGHQMFKFDSEKSCDTTSSSIRNDEDEDSQESIMSSSNASWRQHYTSQPSTSSASSTSFYAQPPVLAPLSTHIDSHRLATTYHQPQKRQKLPSLSISGANYAFPQRKPSSAPVFPSVLRYPSQSVSDVQNYVTTVNSARREDTPSWTQSIDNNISSYDYSPSYSHASVSALAVHPSSPPSSLTSTERPVSSRAGAVPPSAISSSRGPLWNTLSPRLRQSTPPQAQEPLQHSTTHWSDVNTSAQDKMISTPAQATYSLTSFPPSASSSFSSAAGTRHLYERNA